MTSSFKGTNGQVSGDVFVQGGTAVTVTQAVTNSTVNESNVQGAVSVVGTAITTAVTVNQDKTVAASATGLGLVGKTAGAVTVTDVNAASTTAAGAIATVSLNNAGAALVNSGALTTLNLAGSLDAVNAGTLGALTTPANTTLAVMNLTGAAQATGKALTIDSDITTLNISGNTTASTIDSLVSSATKINVSGDAKVTFTGNTTAAVTDIVVTNTGGAAFGTAIGAGVNFTGGAGADSVKLTGNITKAITMGAGNDTVTYSGTVGTGGSVAAGDGTDTIIMTVADAESVAGASSSSVFNTKFTGFEVLTLSNSGTGTVDMDGINAASQVNLSAAVNAGGLTLNNLASNGTVKITTDASGALTVGVKSAIVAAVNGNASLAGIATASDSTGGVMKVTFLVDGVQTASTFGGAAATGVVVLDGTGTSTAGTAGTTAIDTIDGGAGADVIVGGGGADTITTGAGADTVFMLKAHSTLATMATITDYTYAIGDASNDKLILGDVVAAIGTVTTVQDLSASATLAAADAAALANTGVANGLSVFIWGGNEYAYVESTAANTTYTTGDFMVKLIGLPLAAGATIAGSGFDAV